MIKIILKSILFIFLVNNQVFSKDIISDFFNSIDEAHKESIAKSKSDDINKIMSSQIDYSITPEKLFPIFELGTKHTDIQRENVFKDIKGKTIQWDLVVFEVEKLSENKYKIQTQSYGNDKVGTFIRLITRNNKESEYVEGILTDNNIKIRGIIDDVSMRHIVIDPAILVNEQYSQPVIQEQSSSEPTNIPTEPTTESYSKSSSDENNTTIDFDHNSTAINLIKKMITAENEQELYSAKNSIESLPKPQRINRKEARKLNDQALLLMRESNNTDAIPILESAHKYDLTDAEITNNLATAYFFTGETSKAKDSIVDTLTLKPDRSLGWKSLGYIFSQEQNLYAAKWCFFNYYRFAKDRIKARESLLNLSEKETNKTTQQAILSSLETIDDQKE